jgi:hypothetical protein
MITPELETLTQAVNAAREVALSHVETYNRLARPN